MMPERRAYLYWMVGAVLLGSCGSESVSDKPPVVSAEEGIVQVVAPEVSPSEDPTGTGGEKAVPSKFLVFDPAHPFSDDFADGRLFRHWQIGNVGTSLPIEEARVRIHEGAIQMDLIGRGEEEVRKSVTSAVLFPPQSFSQEVELVVEKGSAGMVGATLLFGPPGGGGPSAQLQCAIVDPAEIEASPEGGIGFPTPHFNCNTSPASSEAGGEGLEFEKMAGRAVVFHVGYDSAGKMFTARVTLKQEGTVLFEAVNIPVEVLKPFSVGLMLTARRGPKTGRESVILTRWDNYGSSLQMPDGYLISYSPLSFAGVAYDDVFEPFPTKGAVISARFSPESGSIAPVLGPYTRVPPGIDGSADVNAALVSMPEGLHLTAYTLLEDSGEVASIFRKFNPEIRVEAVVLGVFRSRGIGRDYE